SSLEELVDTHGGGLKYETKDELRGAIRRMIDDAALRRRLGEEGRAAYESEFASEAFIEHYLDVATDLLAKRRSGESLTPAAADAGRGMLAGRRVLWAQDD
ncbi:MAG: hypothetical protein CMJ49_04800, partial [Planctomycetaceae bacterium]|nr:hypothetical protein [Planctomycetaceae bacterium]